MAVETMITLFLGGRIQQLRHLNPEQLDVKLGEAKAAYLQRKVISFWVSEEKGEPEHTGDDLQGEEAVLEGVVPT